MTVGIDEIRAKMKLLTPEREIKIQEFIESIERYVDAELNNTNIFQERIVINFSTWIIMNSRPDLFLLNEVLKRVAVLYSKKGWKTEIETSHHGTPCLVFSGHLENNQNNQNNQQDNLSENNLPFVNNLE